MGWMGWCVCRGPLGWGGAGLAIMSPISLVLGPPDASRDRQIGKCIQEPLVAARRSGLRGNHQRRRISWVSFGEERNISTLITLPLPTPANAKKNCDSTTTAVKSPVMIRSTGGLAIASAADLVPFRVPRKRCPAAAAAVRFFFPRH